MWLQEGLARFEQVRWRAEPSLILPTSDRRLLATALKNRRLIGFDEMGPSFAKLPSHDAAALAYAEVFTLVAWMHGQVGYGGLRAMLGKITSGRSARRAVADLEEAHQARGFAAAGKFLALTPQRGEVGAGAGAVFEEAGFADP